MRRDRARRLPPEAPLGDAGGHWRSPRASRVDARGAAGGAACAGRGPRVCGRASTLPPREAGGRRCEALGLRHGAATLLEHLPRERREARADRPSCAPGEQATVRGRGALDRARARCAGAGCARWSRRPSPTRPGRCAPTFFNQPWLRRALPPGHAPAAARQGRGAAAASASPTTRPAGELGERRRTGGRGRPLPRHRGRQLDPDPQRSCARTAPRSPTSPSRCPAALRARRAAARPRARRWRRCTSRERRRRPRRAAGGWPSRSCCSCSSRCCAAARAARAPERPRAALGRRRAQLDARAGWRARCRSRSTADQRAAIAAIDADLAGARPMQRLLMGEVG